MSSALVESFKATTGKTITCKAAVAWEPKKPLDVTDIQIAPPKAGEVRVKVISNALCHTDIYTLDGHDPEGLFPCVLGHEAAAVVESVGEGVTSVIPGDVVIPCYTPECKQHDCIFCQSPKTNLCPSIRGTQGQGFMPDGTSRLSKDGKPIFHFMGCSTFAEYAVIAEISAAKINPGADLNKMCLLGCGVATGWGAVFNTTKVHPGASVAVFGLGALGLSVIQAAKVAGARYIVGVDINDSKFAAAVSMGATECVNSMSCEGGDVKSWLLAREKWGYDFTYDCTGIVQVMRCALEVAHRGWGESCVIGVAAAGKEISTRPFQLVTGRNWKGTAFGGWKARTEVPKLVQTVMRGEMALEPYITHTYQGLEHVNESIDALHSGSCLRAVIHIGESGIQPQALPKLKGNVRFEGGWLKQMSHWSESCQCEMTFSVFLPDQQSRTAPLPPVLYYLSGLTCTDDNARTKSQFAQEAAKVGLAVVFPDTSPRGSNIPGEEDSWDYGTGAGFYVNATAPNWSKNYRMYDYVTKELPELVAGLFPVDPVKMSVTGHSMGGHGALICHLKNPGKYTSVSAFAPICNPTAVPWGEKAFSGYLGSVEDGKAYDATELIKTYKGPTPNILIDQGTADSFLKTQLKPENFSAAAAKAGYPVEVRMQPLYDHSYFFIGTFMRDHIDHHARAHGLRPKL
ncbi:alcohol dehydrogenase class-3 [Eurytemora carolleeae]|uniref:alcohol dehydrogenase class-3 n=1 Tax=Eurytemora carolleeae TaxID=1294199 RepID=UPI000C77F217|nr:alcohol dehydrogenase class-3 [Eurytemora carolleeae]|eukprot:XP_023326261.1 alcohol dehydrogenase class-3-like [Eurytemora affinis]